MIVFGVLGAGYSVIRPSVYSARQPLVVRDEATGSVDRLGRFSSQTELKAAQETILEMTQNPEVVSKALKQIGPPGGGVDASWPRAGVVDSVIRSSVNLVAPKGSEFGNTEVVYLGVKASTPERASFFCTAMYDKLTAQLRDVRRVRADSVIDELTHARDLAARNLNRASMQIREIEMQFGTDLGELRNLNDTISGDGTNRRTLAEQTQELQAAELELLKLESQHQLLVEGARNPQRLLISGSQLLEQQPSLSRLKDGLIDAQLAASQMAGLFTPNNPKLRAAMKTEQEIRTRMQQETAAAADAMKPVLKLQRGRVQRFRDRVGSLSKRLETLATIRTDYAKLDSNIKHRTEIMADAEKALSEALASRSAALSTNLVARLGPPQVGDHPIGPGKMVLTLGSSLAGLIFGLGSVFLVAPGPTDSRSGRRWSDYLGSGRRRNDRELQAGENGDRGERDGQSSPTTSPGSAKRS